MSPHPSTIEGHNPQGERRLSPTPGRRLTWLLLALVFLGAVGLGSWFGLNRIENRTRENVGDSLSVMVGIIHDSLREWYRTERDFARRMARRPEVVQATRELLAAPRSPEALRGHESFQKLRKYFAARESYHENLGFFLVAPDGVNLFSMRDANVGVRNLIAESRRLRLERAFSGESTLVLPLPSDVPIPHGEAEPSEGAPTMFIATPVKSEEGEVIAVLTVRMDPASDFTRIFQTGRIGGSGESYAFDREGWMLSGSRFEDELIDIGVIKPGGRSILGIRIADPGRRLSAQNPADASFVKNPLTLMANRAINGTSDVNTAGYRDYRGQRVLGAWQWDHVLELGITSEIDETEALAVYGTTRVVVATILILTVILAFALAAYLVRAGEQDEFRRHLAEEKAAAVSIAQAKSEFLAHMSHEIRTPLNAIIGFSQLLRRDDSIGEENRRAVRTIERSGNHLLTLINDILEMSKIESGQLTRNVESVSLLGIAEDMREMMGLKATQKGLHFELQWDDALPEFVDIDSGKFRQIVLNLLSNAVKFTESGSVRLTFEAADDPEIDSAGSLRVMVTDSGSGISEEEQEMLFGAFYQSDAGRRQQGGTGLGLAISARFAEFLGGDISLESEVGKGSTFTLRLPLEASTNRVSTSGSGGGTSGPEIVGLDLAAGDEPPRILVAEDQAANRELMERLLGEVGFQLRFVENGREAVEQIGEWNPDFVWMDLKMPEMNGDEAAVIIREKFGNDLPVVALTASALTVDRDALIESGFSDVLTKPIRPPEIFASMAAFLDLRYLTKDVETRATENDSSVFSRLAELPDSLKKKLRENIDLGDLAGIKNCVDEIRAIDPSLADALAEPLANFAFGSILEALGNPESKK